MTQMQKESSGAGAVVATVGCSVLGMMLAGPVGAVIGGGLAIVATAGSSSGRRPQRLELTISSISMPQDGIIRQHGVTYFAMDVVDKTGSTWRVLRRYNHFDAFRKALRCKRLPRSAAFPGKLWFGCEGHRLVERRRRLETWTREVLRSFGSAGVPGRLESEINDFFTRGRGNITPLQAGATAAAYPEGSFPIEVPSGVVAGQQLTVKNPMDGSSFNIVVPEGMGPGSILQVQPPSMAGPSTSAAAVNPDASVCPTPKSSFRAASDAQKTLLSISVPPGVQPGQMLAVKVPDGRELTVVVPNGARQELQLELDAASGTLTVLDDTLENSEPQKSQGSRSESDDLFQIYVPSGVRPGQSVNIQVPDGRHLPFTVPAGKRPGDELLLCLDTTRSRLLQA